MMRATGDRRARQLQLPLRPFAIASFVAISITTSGAAGAQEAERDPSIENLPRPGYEPRQIRLGKTVIAPEASYGVAYDDNIFATSTAKDDDFVFRLAPRINVTRDSDRFRMRADAYATILRYAENTSENTENYGVGTSVGYIGDPKHSGNLSLRYDHTFERRTDPESNPYLTIPPSEIDILNGEYRYQYRPGRIGIGASFGFTKVDYLTALENDRDLTAYRVTLRGSYRASGRLDFFIEGFGNRRDNRLAFDRSGIDRDTTTWGATAGVRVDIADRLDGEGAIGFLRANPDDSRTLSFSGISANGRLTWRPRVRTAVSLDFFNGDVATIRNGANGRIDTRIGLRVDQEVRHNLIAHAGVSLRNTTYRGGISRDLTNVGGEVGAEYLFNRHASVGLNASYSKRTADLATDEFDKFTLGLALRLRF